MSAEPLYKQKGISLKTCCISDVGRIRQNNEDTFLILEEVGLFAVADGMGGHNSGEVASQTAVEALREFYQDPSRAEELRELFRKKFKSRKYKGRKLTFDEFFLKKAIEYSNLEIFTKAKDNDAYSDMGTTIACIQILGEEVLLGHVGDSRVYRFRDNDIIQITEDHSLANEYIKLKILDPADVHRFPYKNVIVRALGLNETVAVDTNRIPFKVGDTFLICSDGLTDMVSDEEIQHTLAAHSNDLQMVCRLLVERSNNYGGYDNITTIVVQVRDENWQPSPTENELEILTPQEYSPWMDECPTPPICNRNDLPEIESDSSEQLPESDIHDSKIESEEQKNKASTNAMDLKDDA